MRPNRYRFPNASTRGTIFWAPWGPLLQYRDNVLIVHDLNPEVRIWWCMSRLELFRVGLACILRSMMPMARINDANDEKY